MRLIYAILLGAGWGYIGSTFHWPLSMIATASIMTVVLAFYVSRVIEDDRK